MKKKIRFKKFYQKPKDGEIVDSIIAYKKIQLKTEITDCSDLDNVQKYFSVQYKKILVIDLWAVVIQLEWLTKKKECYIANKINFMEEDLKKSKLEDILHLHTCVFLGEIEERIIETVENWFTNSPQYRTKQNLLEDIRKTMFDLM